MKHLLLITALLSAPAMAEETGVPCSQVAELAKHIMIMRQYDKPMPEAYKLVEGFPLGQAMVIDAYERPHYQTQKHKDRMALEFENLYFLGCLQAKGKSK